MIHMHATQGFIKDYLAGNDYENKDHYILNMSYIMLNDEEIFIMGALGKIKPKSAVEFFDILKKKNINRIIAYFPTDWVARGFTEIVGTNLHKREL